MTMNVFVLVYVRDGCIDTVTICSSVREAIDSFDMDKLHDPEGDDLAVYNERGELKARWFPDVNEGGWVHISSV